MHAENLPIHIMLAGAPSNETAATADTLVTLRQRIAEEVATLKRLPRPTDSQQARSK